MFVIFTGQSNYSFKECDFFVTQERLSSMQSNQELCVFWKHLIFELLHKLNLYTLWAYSSWGCYLFIYVVNWCLIYCMCFVWRGWRLCWVLGSNQCTSRTYVLCMESSVNLTLSYINHTYKYFWYQDTYLWQV